MKNLINSTRPLVMEYEEMRKYVHATYRDIFGQDAWVFGRDNNFGPMERSDSYSPKPDPYSADPYADNPGHGVAFVSNADDVGVGANSPSDQLAHLPGPLRENSLAFADGINPAQEKALAYIANALEVAGRFIASLDTSGIAYSSADRKARFPDPPGEVT
jgi:hypothetical protein